MKTSSMRILHITIMVSLAACSPVATEPPASAVALPATSTPIPPTATETPVPTATVAVQLENIIGIWTREDPERGTLFLVFREDGTFEATHGSPQGIVHTGTYTAATC